jgi:hypothetical protein
MAQELWTSRSTGYQRNGTRLQDLRVATGAAAVVRTIAEPLVSIPSTALASEVKELLNKRRFDVAGVQEGPDGPVIGFALAEDLIEGSIRQHTRPMTSEHLISDSATLGELLKVLGSRQQVFLLTGTAVSSIVTRADLNKPPVRVYLFGIVSLLELHLRYWVRTRYGDETWQALVNEDRLEEAKALQEKRKRYNEDTTTLIDCLQFCDLVTIVMSDELLRKELGFDSKKKGQKALGRAERLRNDLAHSQDDLASGSDWNTRLELFEVIEATLERSEALVLREVRSPGQSQPQI